MKASLGLSNILVFLMLLFLVTASWGQAKVMNPGVAVGQLVHLSVDDVRQETSKFKALNPLSIPVFAELPMDLSVVAGAITLKQQNLVSHVQLKSRARHTPNLDISELPGGLNNELMKPFRDGDWIVMKLTLEGGIFLSPSTEQEALAYAAKNKTEPVKLKTDLSAKAIYPHAEVGWKDADKVGSKAANYAELARALNTPERQVVVPGFALPFFYYQEFVDSNPAIKAAIEKILRDPMITKPTKTAYRDEKLQSLRALMTADEAQVNPQLIDDLLKIFDQIRTADGLPAKMKLRSSTNSEDLPNFNGAGLYDSEVYKPTKDNEEKPRKKKEKALQEALKAVWASVWNLRAFEERTFFQIPHAEVRMGLEMNPSFGKESVDGVIITKNILQNPELKGKAVYIEAQRGSTFSVANPAAGSKPEKILVLVNEAQPLEKDSYRIHVVQKSNVADDEKTLLPTDNPKPLLTDEEVKDAVWQVLKAEGHFKPLLGKDKNDFALDLEFKVTTSKEKGRQLFLKQARPYID